MLHVLVLFIASQQVVSSSNTSSGVVHRALVGGEAFEYSAGSVMMSYLNQLIMGQLGNDDYEDEEADSDYVGEGADDDEEEDEEDYVDGLEDEEEDNGGVYILDSEGNLVETARVSESCVGVVSGEDEGESEVDEDENEHDDEDDDEDDEEEGDGEGDEMYNDDEVD